MNDTDSLVKLLDILFRADPCHTAYIYRIGTDGRVLRPYLHKCAPWPDLLEMLRDDFGGGDFKIMVRSGRIMVFAGEISVARPQHWRFRFAR